MSKSLSTVNIKCLLFLVKKYKATMLHAGHWAQNGFCVLILGTKCDLMWHCSEKWVYYGIHQRTLSLHGQQSGLAGQATSSAEAAWVDGWMDGRTDGQTRGVYKGKVFRDNWRSLDLKMTMRTRLNFKCFFRVFSKSRHPEKLNCTFFNQKS